MALAACFGSPLLMNLIGTGGALSAHMIANGGKAVEAKISQNCRIAYLYLGVAIASHMVVFPHSGCTRIWVVQHTTGLATALLCC